MEGINLHQSAGQSGVGGSRSTPVGHVAKAVHGPQEESPRRAAGSTRNARAICDGNRRKPNEKLNGYGNMVGAEATPTARVNMRVDGEPAAGHTGAAGDGGARARWSPGRLRGGMWARMRVICEWNIAEFRVTPGGEHVIACEVSGACGGRTRLLSLWDIATEVMDGDGGELYASAPEWHGELSALGYEVYDRAVAAMGPPPPDGDPRWDAAQCRYDVPARAGGDHDHDNEPGGDHDDSGGDHGGSDHGHDDSGGDGDGSDESEATLPIGGHDDKLGPWAPARRAVGTDACGM